MKKPIVLFLAVLVITALAVGVSAQALKDPYTNKQLYVLLHKVFVSWPGDKSEKLVFVTADGQLFVFAGGSHDVAASLGDVIRALARKGQSLGTVTNVVHNHERGLGFSWTDAVLFERLKKLGFVGKFQVFYPETGKIKTLEKREAR